MKNKIDVSVIIPAYNAAETIDSLVNKIFSEPRVAIELIVINDGSTDGTDHALHQIHDDRLILIEQANQGVYAARNTALALHQGEWVIFLDADDDIADGFIEKRWQAASAKAGLEHRNYPYDLKRFKRTGISKIPSLIPSVPIGDYRTLQIQNLSCVKDVSDSYLIPT